jgi:tRNA U38,U39,U40 pseudouridine synthase TruA
MPRYRLTVEYDGTPYVGFQRQTNGYAVQEAIEKAIRKFTGEDVTLHVAGRTDTGVHATGQVCHVDLTRDWDAFRVMEAMNAHLVMADECVAILDAKRWTRISTPGSRRRQRHYLYRILNRHTPIPLERERAWWVKRPLDIAPCRMPRRSCSARMTSPPSAPPSASRNRRSRRSTRSSFPGPANWSRFGFPRAASCTTRSAPSSVR